MSLFEKVLLLLPKEALAWMFCFFIEMKDRYGLEIRAAVSTDATGLAELLAEADQAIDPRVLVDRLDAVRRGSGGALIASEWGPPSGLVVFHWYPTLAAAQPVALVTMLLVRDDARRKGIGRLLIKAAAQAARVAGCGALALSAGSDQSGLPAFCGATGFTATGTHFVRALRRAKSG